MIRRRRHTWTRARATPCRRFSTAKSITTTRTSTGARERSRATRRANDCASRDGIDSFATVPMMTTMTDDDDARDAQARGVTAGYREDVAEESFVVRGARGDARGERRDVGWMGTDEWASFPQTGAGDEDAADADDETDRGRAMIADGVAWIGRATIERVDSLRCERERVERAGWERRRRARRRGERVAGSAEAEGD